MIFNKEITKKAPGRVCLFGDHQDYLGLPVIACAIDKFAEIKGVPNETEFFHINMPDIKRSRSFHIEEKFESLKKGDFIASVIKVLRRYGCIPTTGYTVTIKSKVPVNAGLSSSSAIVVSWVRFLLNAFGSDHEITDQLIAQISYEAEVIEHNSPGGKMDQYTIAIGDIIFLETDEDSKYVKIDTNLEGLVIGESGIPKNTVGLLGDLKGKALRSIKVVQDYDSNFKIDLAILSDVEKYSEVLSEELKPFFYASIKNHTITQKAFSALNNKSLNYQEIGRLMNEHHEVLRDILKITTPKIDAMITAALEAGAYGAKIVGSGGGGCICAIAPKENQQKVIECISNAGAKDAYAVTVVSNQRDIEV